MCASPSSTSSPTRSRISASTSRSSTAVETEGEDFALTALVEGDATSVEDDYLFSLPQAEQDAYFAEVPDDPSPSDTPPVLDTFTSGPYIFGSRYVELLRQAGGKQRVDHTFAVPARERGRDHRPGFGTRRTERTARGDAEVGGRRTPSGEAERVRCVEPLPGARVAPRPRAFAARRGGVGRRSVRRLHHSGCHGRECLRISVTGDTDADTGELRRSRSRSGRRISRGCGDLGAGRRSRRRHRVRYRFHTRARRSHARGGGDDARRSQRHRARAAAGLGTTPRRSVRRRPSRRRSCVRRAARHGEQFTPEQEDQFTELVTSAVTACQTT